MHFLVFHLANQNVDPLFMFPAVGEAHLNIDVNEFYSKKITNKVSQQIQVSDHVMPCNENSGYTT